MDVERIAYGSDPSQYGELTRPPGASRGVVIVIHGGFWRSAYDLSLGRPLAADLAARGWTALNLEYRRVGAGGGHPATFDDVAAGIDALAGLDLDLTRVVTLGHSAGGHLAAWAAARGRYDAWSPARVPVTQVIAQAGVLDLVAASRDRLSTGAVEELLGGSPTDARLDPARQLPLDVPVRCLHARDDDLVPWSQSASYVERARAAGADAELVEVTGGHFGLIDPTHPAWGATLTCLPQ